MANKIFLVTCPALWRPWPSLTPRKVELLEPPLVIYVCLSTNISQKPDVHTSRSFQCLMLVAMAQSFSGGVAIHGPVLWMTSCLHITTRHRQPEKAYFKMTHTGSTGGCEVRCLQFPCIFKVSNGACIRRHSSVFEHQSVLVAYMTKYRPIHCSESHKRYHMNDKKENMA